MAHIAPFRALRYDPKKVSPQDVVTQPYDKISPELREAYYAASPYNLVRIILGKQDAEDDDRNNPYTRAAQYFHSWRRDGVFLQDSLPAIYLYAQRFTAPGTTLQMERRGFIALGKVEDYSAGVVFRHEQTLSKPKADRLELLRSTRAHFGQIFMLYSDPANEVEGILSTNAPPDTEVRDEYGVHHRVWKISDSALLNLIQGKMRDKKLIIADGHHRYETALNYRNERRSTAASDSARGFPRQYSSEKSFLNKQEEEIAPYELAMMTFVNMDSPGLLILPTHRVVCGLTTFSAEKLAESASSYFNVTKIEGQVGAPHATTLLRDAGKNGAAILAVMQDHSLLLDKPKGVGTKIFGNLSVRQQALDVVRLHKCLLEGALGLSEESIRNQENIRYIRDAEKALTQVYSGDANVAFLMNAARMEQVRDVAFAGEVMPQKSTDFFPKLLSGFAIYALD
jgi:uncharacterized protein (DUF1015 family)